MKIIIIYLVAIIQCGCISQTYKHSHYNYTDENDSATYILNLHPDIRDAYLKESSAGVVKIIHAKCGNVNVKSVNINLDLNMMIIDFAIKDRLKIVNGMHNEFGFSQKDIDHLKKVISEWDPEIAVQNAEKDYKAGKIGFYYAGSVGSALCGLSMEKYDELKKYAVLDAGIGCTSEIPAEARIYGCIYNKTMYKLLKRNKGQNQSVQGTAPERAAPDR
jgi:hypothetical protein